MKLTAVRDRAVVGMPDKIKGGQIIKAFVAFHEGVAAETRELMDFLAERVEPYKRIQEIALISEVPRNFSGKILRRVLRGG